jgi:hypothetical protein
MNEWMHIPPSRGTPHNGEHPGLSFTNYAHYSFDLFLCSHQHYPAARNHYRYADKGRPTHAVIFIARDLDFTYINYFLPGNKFESSKQSHKNTYNKH